MVSVCQRRGHSQKDLRETKCQVVIGVGKGRAGVRIEAGKRTSSAN